MQRSSMFALALFVLSPYATKSIQGTDWFVDPAGKPFWSFAVDCVDTGVEPSKRNRTNPGYSGLQHYPDEASWANGTAARLRRWGFNSLGGWSDADAMKGSGLPYFVVLHLGAYHHVPWDDLFDAPVRKAVWAAASALVPKHKDDPNLIGYFTDNELGWWGDTLFLHYLKKPPTSPGKRRLMSEIRRIYPSYRSFQRDWITPAKSFDELSRQGKAWIRPGGHGMRLVNRWLSVVGDRYYSMVRSAVKAYDGRHLILGDRYPQFYELPIAQSSAKYVDVASTNMGATWNDGSLTPFFLDTLHRATGKPVVITEFYMGATENRSGNKNEPPAFPVVATQKERAAAFARNVRELASLPYVVGAHWFQFYDEPPKGRGDGENFNHGLVDIEGRPYEEMIAASAAANPTSVHWERRRPAGGRTYVRSTPYYSPLAGEPPAVPVRAMQDLKSWPRRSGWIASSSKFPLADLYACADSSALYLGVLSMDYLDESLYPGSRIPERERSTWTVRLSGHSPIVVRFGGRAKATVSDPRVWLSEVPGLQHTVLLRIPRRLGRARLESTLNTHSRSHLTSWRTTLTGTAGGPPARHDKQ